MNVLNLTWDAPKRELDPAPLPSAESARSAVFRELALVCRRFRQYENETQWLSTLRDGVSLGADTFAILSVQQGRLRLRLQQNLALPESLQIPFADARAVAAVADSGEPVVALRTPSEVGTALAAEDRSRAHLVPISNGSRMVALIFAVHTEALDNNALELVAAISGAVLERQANRSLYSQITPVAKAEPQSSITAGVRRSLPAWADLEDKDRLLHARAQRFARVAIAEMLLARPEACRSGREQGNIYLFLQAEIDKARETYSSRFMTISSMIDFLHQELVAVAAGGDEIKLGADYPGPLL